VQALVLVHGWASSTVAWSKQFPALSERARVLVVDLIGHGVSDAPDITYTMQGMADSVRAAMDEASVERAVLVAHSNGVPVVLDFAHRYPERTLAVVAIDGALKSMLPRETFDAMFAAFHEPDWRDTMTAMIAGMPAPDLSDDDRAAITAMAVATEQHVVIGAAEAVYQPGAFHDPSLDVPVLLLLVRQPTWDDAYEGWVRVSLPQVEYVVWDGVGHYIQMERPEAFRALLEAFLDQHGLLPE
jgi:pimeloyl-ACP methyl ester carboxylesterase